MTVNAPSAGPAPGPRAGATAPPEAPGRLAQGKVIELAPPAEVPAAGEPRESVGHRAGLHKTPDALQLTSSAAVVVDQTTGQVLFRKNEDAVLPIASLTKLMTAIVISEAKLPPD